MHVGVGTRLGPYEIVSLLGEGGMGRVYLGRDSRLKRHVAIKLIAADLAADAQARTRFQREARTVAALTHPRICGLYDIGSTNGFDYLVMEHLDGETLQARLQRMPLQRLFVDAYDREHRDDRNYDGARDGRFLMLKSQSGAPLLNVVLNWFTELQQRVN